MAENKRCRRKPAVNRMDEILAGLRDISSNPKKQLERFISEGKR
jgi:hypothetical protein